ncbi:MAG: hypothetical protein AB1476_06130 [Candidatus Hadarchaeota archaeon]
MVEAEKPIYDKLAELESEIKGLKLMVRELAGKPKGIVALHGALKGITVDEEEFKEAERSLFGAGD